ncbi:MAG: 3-hydroxyacyl-CoA dehydrogenase NAD-binding domain-containing protein [Desulfobulbaceae bacterium]|nr:3-hydroxyacyl-CoA dehydrogenase NAD-binding domain-containing protein [Desulfobulbaceae bacterium]
MKQKILIVGSGKMACNIGDFFLEKGHCVHWVTSSLEQQAKLKQRIAKAHCRTAKFFPEQREQFNADCHLLTAGDIPTPDMILESTHESLQKKREVFSSLSHLVTKQTLVFSNSSSLLPDTLYPDCLGAHFFYPLQLTGCIELIIPKTCSEWRRRESIQFFQENGLDIFVQDEKTAFLINRLLLPLQAACLQALQDGYPAPVVEEASKSELIAFGQLSMMDTIGLDLIHTAAINYRNLPDTVLPDCDLLISGLEQLLHIGKRGKKGGNGLHIGAHLPWPTREVSAEEQKALREHLGSTLKEACLREYHRQSISLDQLQMACERIFQAKNFPRSFFTEVTGETAGNERSLAGV